MDKPAATKDDKSNISDYLQAPRKKRKNYVIVAMPQEFDPETTIALESFVRKQFPNLAVSRPESVTELTRQFGRNISLLIVSDEFEPEFQDKLMDLILALKEKRRTETIPVMFLSRSPEKLIADYHNKLLAYHETDDYFELPITNRLQFFARVKDALELKNKRRGKRYNVSLKVQFHVLSRDRNYVGELKDLSVYGASIQSQEDLLFRTGDQIRISIPTSGILPPTELGEFFKVSAKVRRVFISGTTAGISFEHLSIEQHRRITALLTVLVNRDLARKTARFRATNPQITLTAETKPKPNPK